MEKLFGEPSPSSAMPEIEAEAGAVPAAVSVSEDERPARPSPESPPAADTAQLHWIENFIWGIADDVLRDLYVRSKYRDVILPMTVLRRLDAVLEPTKQAVLDMKANLDAARIVHQDQALRQAAGQAFYNTSKFTLRALRARASQQARGHRVGPEDPRRGSPGARHPLDCSSGAWQWPGRARLGGGPVADRRGTRGAARSTRPALRTRGEGVELAVDGGTDQRQRETAANGCRNPP